MKAYKLFSVKKDGSIGSLFINRKQRLALGQWYEAESHKTSGYAYRPFWHCCAEPKAPHLKNQTKTDTRRWYEVEIEDATAITRPDCQGGKWYLAGRLKVIKPV